MRSLAQLPLRALENARSSSMLLVSRFDSPGQGKCLTYQDVTDSLRRVAVDELDIFW